MNSGHNVQFKPDVKDATLENYKGIYTVQQFSSFYFSEGFWGSFWSQKPPKMKVRCL